jgi:hypothetical protein
LGVNSYSQKEIQEAVKVVNAQRERNFLIFLKGLNSVKLDVTQKKLEYRGQETTNFYQILIQSNGFRKVWV